MRTCLFPTAIGPVPYRRMTERLTGLRLVFVDLHGGAALTFDSAAADFAAARRELGEERTVVIGHSILGMLAIEYARRCPEAVSHVVVVGTPPSGDMARLRPSVFSYFAAHASNERKRALAANMDALPAAPTLTQAMIAQTPIRFFDMHADAAALFEGAETRPELLPHLMGTLGPSWDVTAGAPLVAPLLVAHGRHDYAVPHTLWDDVLPRLPTATMRIFEESGHQPFYEEPERFSAEVAAFTSG
jgi:proline iminopeptidase